MQIQGQVEVNSPKNNGIKVQGQWYNVPPGAPLPNKGDMVSFFAAPDPSGRGQQAQNMQVQPGQPQQRGGGNGYRGNGGKGGGGGFKRTPRDVYGPIVGHNLLIAATLLGPGHGVQELIALAREIMQASEQLVNETIQQHEQPAQPQQYPQPQYQQPQQPQNQGHMNAPANGFAPPQQPPQQGTQYPQPAGQGSGWFDDDIPL